MPVRVSQIVEEVVLLPDPVAKVSQIVMEVVLADGYSTPGAVSGAAVSQVAIEVLLMPNSVPAVVSQVAVEVLMVPSFDEAETSYPIWVG